MYRFLHVFDNNILTKLYAFLLFSKNRSVVLSLKRSRDRPSRHAHSVVEKFYPFPPIRKRQVFSYLDLVYKFKKIIGNPNFSNLLKRIVNRFKRAGYSLDIMRQTACLVFNPIKVEGYAALFNCTAVVQASDSMTASM